MGVPRGWADLALVALNSGISEVVLPHLETVRSAAVSPDGKRIVTASMDKTVRVWSELTPLRGTEDLKLWTAIPYCMAIERRIELLGVSEATARAEQRACQRRVEEARVATGGHD